MNKHTKSKNSLLPDNTGRYPQWIQSEINDIEYVFEEDDKDDEGFNAAHQHLEAKAWLEEEGEQAYEWFVSQLPPRWTDSSDEATTRANMLPEDLKGLVKELQTGSGERANSEIANLS